MNTEFSAWVNFFKQPCFEQYMRKMKQLCAGKKVVIYCNGIYFSALADVYNLSDYFNVIGVSDIKYENSDIKYCGGFATIKPSMLKKSEVDIVLVASPNFQNIKRFLDSQGIAEHVLSLYFEPEINVGNNYEKVLNGLRKKDKIRVLFVCEENSKWSYSKLYKKFENNPRFEVLPVVLFPIITANRVEFTQNKSLDFLRKEGISAIDGYDYENKCNRDLKEFEPDIVFYQQPWYLYGCNHPYKVSEYALTAMVPYGYTTLSLSEWGSESVKKVYAGLWKFFSESPYHSEFYKKAAGMKDENLYVAGSLKLDNYREPVVNNLDFWLSDGKRIIWAPHHSINNDGLRMGTFRKNYEFFLEYAKKHPEFSFVLKPHPALRNVCINSGIAYDDYINKWSSLSNACVYDEGGYFEMFKTSDVLITDCSSFLAEYFPSGKPIVLLNRADRAPFDEFGEKIRAGFYEVNSNYEISETLENLLEKEEDILKPKRREIIEKCFYQCEKTATDMILEYINLLFS